MKYTWKEPKKDDPIFKQGFIISQPKIQNIDLLKIPKKMSHKEMVTHLINFLLNRDGNIQEIKNNCFLSSKKCMCSS